MIWVIRNSPLNNIVQFGMLSCTTMETWSLIICQLTRRRLAGFLVSGKLITLPQYSYSVQRHNIQQVGQHRSHRVQVRARVQVTQVRVGQHWSQLGYRLHRLGQVNIVHCQGIGHIGQGRSTLVLAMVQVTQVRIGQHRSQLAYRSHRSGQVNTGHSNCIGYIGLHLQGRSTQVIARVQLPHSKKYKNVSTFNIQVMVEDRPRRSVRRQYLS